MQRKLSNEDYLEIYERLQNGETQKRLSKEYKVSQSTIHEAKERAIKLFCYTALKENEKHRQQYKPMLSLFIPYKDNETIPFFIPA